MFSLCPSSVGGKSRKLGRDGHKYSRRKGSESSQAKISICLTRFRRVRIWVKTISQLIGTTTWHLPILHWAIWTQTCVFCCTLLFCLLPFVQRRSLCVIAWGSRRNCTTENGAEYIHWHEKRLCHLGKLITSINFTPTSKVISSFFFSVDFIVFDSQKKLIDR